MTQNSVRKVEISLLGHVISLRSDKSDEQLKGLVRLITERLESMKKSSNSASVTHNMVLLLCLNLADQLLEKEQELRYIKTSLEARATEALKEVQAALARVPDSIPPEVVDEEII